jgi:site-specific recombinase XerD
VTPAKQQPHAWSWREVTRPICEKAGVHDGNQYLRHAETTKGDRCIIQLMLGHASVRQTQRYLNVTNDELRKGLEVSWKRRTLKAVVGGQNA